MTELYPIKFEPILKQRIWGGNALAEKYGKKAGRDDLIGESWELSAVSGDISIVANGFLAGNDLQEIIEVYMGDITGEKVYEKYGDEFPLLIKLIEAREVLSVQVHPNDNLAKERHNAYGKTEMWYILEADKDAVIFTGFREPVTRDLYKNALTGNRLPHLLNAEHPVKGDVLYTPAGRIHAIGAGLTLVEIQQTSDITYRIYDWERMGPQGEPRELHIDLAEDAIDYSSANNCIIRKESVPETTINLVKCDYFVSNILAFGNPVEKDYNLMDSFVIYICVEGEFIVKWDKGSEIVVKGETVLIPAIITELTLEPKPEAKVLEVFANTKSFE